MTSLLAARAADWSTSLFGRPLVVPTAPAATAILAEPVGIGQMYNQVIPVHLPAEADAVFFLPSVAPLRAACPTQAIT